jgi:hypothetical protein
MKIPELKSQYVWATIMILCYILPGFVPLGTPFPMSTTTMKIYNMIQALPDDSIVVIGGSGVFAFDLESSAGTIPAIKIMAQKHIKIVNLPLATEAVQLEKYLIDASRIEKKYGGTYEYGVDWIQLPYLAGAPGALVSFLNDIKRTCPTDVYGTPLDQMPLGQRLKDYKDIVLWICPHWDFVTIIQYVTGERKIPSVSFAQSAAYSTYSPYMMTYPDKVFMTNGFLGGAQMEYLVGMKGIGHAVIDGNQVFSAVFLIFVVLGNVTWLANKEKKEGKK